MSASAGFQEHTHLRVYTRCELQKECHQIVRLIMVAKCYMIKFKVSLFLIFLHVHVCACTFSVCLCMWGYECKKKKKKSTLSICMHIITTVCWVFKYLYGFRVYICTNITVDKIIHWVHIIYILLKKLCNYNGWFIFYTINISWKKYIY